MGGAQDGERFHRRSDARIEDGKNRSSAAVTWPVSKAGLSPPASGRGPREHNHGSRSFTGDIANLAIDSGGRANGVADGQGGEEEGRGE